MECKLRSGVSCSNCCVLGCRNNYANTDKSIKFYNFPGRPHEKERRSLWIESIRKHMLKGSQIKTWNPKPYSKVCSKHFVGNIKSNHPQSPSYVPSIFSKDKSLTERAVKSKMDRFQRYLKRNMVTKCHKSYPEEGNSKNSVEIVVNFHDVEQEKRTQDFSCQIKFEENATTEGITFVFECSFSRDTNDVCTQAVIKNKNDLFYGNMCDKGVNTDEVDVEPDAFCGYGSLKTNEELNSLAGVCFERFNLLKSLLHGPHHNDKLSLENKLLLFLMKMKLGISFCALGVVFGLHRTTVSKSFVAILGELSQKTRNFVYWPNRGIIDFTMPEVFKRDYPRCRAIIDCSEIRVEQPDTVDKRIYMYSHYKGSFTVKFLICIAPNGFISFVSKCYGGRSSDTFITNDSGFLNLLEPGDTILADKGFPGISCKDDVIVVMPPFVHNGRLAKEEVENCYKVATVRIHVERSIQRVKIYNILRNINNSLLPVIDDVVFMCCVLANLQPPILQETREGKE